jgi:hypothetical protein
MNNINLKEEQNSKFAKDPQFKEHQKMQMGADDLHMALRSCQEIGSTKNLYSFMIDVSKVNPR